MVQFFGTLAMLSSSFSIEAVSSETADLSINLIGPFLISTVFPILYRKQFDALPQSEQLFATFMDHLPGYAWIKNVDGSYVYVNERVKQLPPLQRDCLGKTDADLWPSELAAVYRANDLKVIAMGEKVETVEAFVLNGEQRYVLVTRFPIFDENGAISMVGGTSIDITEHKRAEEALNQSRRYLQALFDNSLDAILVTNDEGRYIDANPVACALLGYTHEELMQLGVLDLTAEAFRQEGWAMWQQFLARGSQSGEYSTLRKDGTVMQLEFRAAANILPGVHLSSSRDVTERKRAEEAQREAEQKYRDIFENAIEGIFQTTPDGRFISANPALVKMFGFGSAEELIRERPDISNQHYVDPKCREEFKLRLEEQGVVKGFELEAYRKDGSTIWLSENVRAVRDERGEVLYYEGTAQDITEQRQADQSLRLFRTLIDRSTDAIEVIDPVTLRFLDCNKSAYHDLGYTREEFLSLSVYDIDPLIDEKRSARLAMEMERSGFVIFESVHQRRDGSTFPVEINLKIVRLERDYRLAVVRDITERKLAEEALRQAEQKYRDIFENAVEGIFQISPDGRCISANPALARMFGFNSPEEIIRERSDPSKQRSVDPGRRQEYFRLLSKEGVVRDFEYEDYRKDGSRIWLSDSVHAVCDSEGTLLYYEGTTQDITERKRVERSQRESQLQYETLVQSIDGIVWEADPQTFTFTFVSKQAERILGYPLEQWFEGPDFWPDHMHPDDRNWAVAFCVDSTERRVDHQFEYRMIAADGQVVWLSDIVTVHVVDDQSVLLRGVMVDITERKRIEEKLKQSEGQLAEAQRLTSVGSWNWDIRNNTHSWSDELYRMYGLHPQESPPSYEAFIERVHPDDRADISRAIVHALKTQEPIDAYVRIIRPDGAERIIHSRGNTIGDMSGNPIRMHGTVQDVTERKQAEDALREAERKYRDIFENAGEGIFQSTPAGRFISANPALARMLGFASSVELIYSRQDISRQIYVDPTRREDFKRQLEEQGAVRGFEHQVFRKDLSKIWISGNARAVRNGQGEIQYYEGTAREITDRKRAEEALRESEERYRELFENAKDATYVHDLNGRYTSVNRAAEKLTGYTRTEILGKSFINFVPPEQIENISEHLCRKLVDEGETAYESEVTTKDGRHVAVEVSSHLILENGVPVGVQGTARDITERKWAENQLKQSERELAEAQHMAHVGSWNWDLQSNAVNWSDELYRIFGVDPQALNPSHRHVVMEFIHAEDRDLLSGALESSIKTQEPCSFDCRLLRPDGEERVVHSRGDVVSDEHGNPIRMFGTVQDVTERKQAEERVRGTAEQLRALSARLQSAREEEGTRIAREIHDELGSVLTSLKWDLEATDRILASPMEPAQLAALRERLHALMKLTDLGIGAIRRIASELRPSVLDDLGLVAAIEWQAQQFQARTGIVCYSDCSLEKVELSEEPSTAVFRILQEALTNVLRHAQATRVDIKIYKENGYFALSVSDNGKGITEEKKSEQQSLGILGMRERAHLIAGELDIKGVEGKGTVVIVRVPISGQDRVLKMTR